ncbi:MAG: hypothetical protein WC216_07370 [Gallionella sp.]|jgi:hypothetical protein
MKLASITRRDPYLVQALIALAQRADQDEGTLLHELAGITVLVARKYTNDRTADGLLDAFYLTIGCVSLAMSQSGIQNSAESGLDFLLQKGAEQVFQAGFRLVKELAALPVQCIVTDFDNDPHVQQRNIKALFFELCRADPDSTWNGDEDYRRELLNRRENQRIVDCAKWLRKQHFAGPIKDTDLDANAVIAITVIFAIAGDGRIVARTGQKDIENLIRRVRATPPDIEAAWHALLQKIPPEYQPVVVARMDEYRGTVIKKILSRTGIKSVVTEIQNYHAGIEQDVDYH